MFCGERQQEVTLWWHGFVFITIFAFRVWLWVLWDDHNCFSGQQSQLSMSILAENSYSY